VVRFEANYYTPDKGVPEIHITVVSGKLPVLPDVFSVFSASSGKIWGV
jgi:hypothetical protein